MPHLSAAEVTHLELRDAMLCIECELISYNNTTKCLACGSTAVMSLSRVLGGSLRGKETAQMVGDDALGQMVHDTLAPIDISYAKVPELSVACTNTPEVLAPRFTPSTAMQFVVDRAFTLTRADGAALALWQGNRMVCRAGAGSAVAEIGSEVSTSGGLSGLTLRTGRAWRCNDARNDHRVNADTCRELGIRSVISTPVNHLNRVLGMLQVLSSQPYAFDDRDVATVQLLSNLMVMAFARRSDPRTEVPLDSRLRFALG